ncbi:MAG: hypothetical protein JNL58_18205 [Planctomyces sp.]|nr:hypothetical protein [Planctomyces sp.]
MSMAHWLSAFVSGIGFPRGRIARSTRSVNGRPPESVSSRTATSDAKPQTPRNSSVWRRKRRMSSLPSELLETRLVMSATSIADPGAIDSVSLVHYDTSQLDDYQPSPADVPIADQQTLTTSETGLYSYTLTPGSGTPAQSTFDIGPSPAITYDGSLGGYEFDGSPTGFNGLSGDDLLSGDGDGLAGTDLSGSGFTGSNLPPADMQGGDFGTGMNDTGTDLPTGDLPPADYGGGWGGTDLGDTGGGAVGGGETGGATRNRVTVRAADPEAWEGPYQGTKLDEAEFIVTRSLIHDSLNVSMRLSGTAKPLDDYIIIGENVFQSGDRLLVQFPMFEESVHVKVISRPDTDFEEPELVIATVEEGPGYAVTASSSSQISIVDKTADLDIRGMEGITLDEDREDQPGADLRVNRDDDNENGVPDDSEPYSGDVRENDVGRLEFRHLLNSTRLKSFSGYFTLEFDESIVRIWQARKVGNISMYDPIRSGQTQFSMSVVPELYFDGIRTGSPQIQLMFHSTVGAKFSAQYDVVTARFWDIDLDIDSDNNSNFASPDGSAWEEELEDHEYGIGKLVYPTAPGILFTPVVFNPYPDVFDPPEGNFIRFDFQNAGLSGLMRVWTVQIGNVILRPYPVEAGGHLITPGRNYSATELKAAGWTNGFLYIDAIYASTGHDTKSDVEGPRGKPDDRIRVTVEREGVDNQRRVVGYDEVKYLIVRPDTFFPNLVHELRPTSGRVLRHGILAEAVYERADLPHFGMQKLSLDELQKLGVSPEVRKWLEYPDVSGFKAAMYRDFVSGEYVVAFAGTENYSDWLTDGWQGAGYGDGQYSVAMEIGFVLKSIPKLQHSGVWVTGHSLGGGLASAASVAGGLNANTFNAAGLHVNTLTNWNSIINNYPTKRYPDIIGNYQNRSKDLIHTWHLKWDILTFLQDNITTLPQVLGTRHELAAPWNPQLEIDGPIAAARLQQMFRDGASAYESISYLTSALPQMGEQHTMSWCLYGLTVRHNNDGKIIWDIYGEGFYR